MIDLAVQRTAAGGERACRWLGAVPMVLAGLAGTVSTATAQISPSIDEVCALVDAQDQVHMTYYQDPTDADPRTVDVYGMGRTIAGHPAIFGLQQFGYSRSSLEEGAQLPGFRSFRLDRIVSMDVAGTMEQAYPPSRDDVRNMGSWACVNDVMTAAFE